MRRATAIIAAAGSGERLGRDEPKAFVAVGSYPLLVHAIRAVRSSEVIGRVVVVAPPAALERARALAVGADEVVAGGPSRHRSIAAAITALAPDLPDAVVCHDAARPFATASTFRAVVEALERWDGVVPAVPLTDTLKRIDGDRVIATEPREGLVSSQTPQAFRGEALLDSHRRAADDGREFTDDAACLEWAGYAVGVVPGDAANFKVTTAEDLRRAAAIALASDRA
ncbi:MAG TPA: 2-C-methyl-D-erythritol 4-phosphate cytidylyltransferase [Actinomycetota bacterium]|nr:2-C-methyl-D-erythritol 4-phosphate cytidylyltransferase [Actinomycetota bacterium]